jgi:Rhomboid family
MFVHADIGHIFGNMLGLFFLGPILEMFWGEKRFLIFYLVTGVGAGVLYMALKYYDFSMLEEMAQVYIQNPDLTNFRQVLSKFYADGIPTGMPSSVYDYVT